MKKFIITSAMAACSTSAVAGEIIHGSLSALSGAGYTTANFSEGVLLNPSELVSHSPEERDFGFLLNIGALVSDENKLQDQAEDLSDLTDSIQNSSQLSTAQAQDLKNRLKNIDGDTALVNIGGNLVLAFANKDFISAALVVKSFMQISLTPNIKNSDLALIDSYINKTFDPTDEQTGLQSTVRGKGAAVTEIGIAIAKSFAIGEKNKLQLGITPKRIKVDSIIYTASVANYDDDDWDADQYRLSSNATDIDIGALYVVDNYRFGLTLNNAKGNTFKTIDPNERIELKRQATAAVGYVKDWVSAEVAYDLNSTPAIGLKGDTQYFRAGVDLNVWKFLHLRGGFQQDTKKTVENTFSVGLGAGPFSLAYITGDKRTQGVALGGGFRF